MSRKRDLLIATHNEGKLRELRELIADLPFTLISLAHFPLVETIPETGLTFVENATLKAVGYARQTRLLTLADDSGLEVDALGGIPGVRSARYLKEKASYGERMNALLNELEHTGSRNRAARFVSAVVVAEPEGPIKHVATGVCEGTIAQRARGTGGFGYDPIFIPKGFDSTFAELSAEVKNKISHRARALHQARAFLKGLTDDSRAG